MKPFYKLLGIAFLLITTNTFVWFALTYWAYLSTQSVLSTSIMAGTFLVMSASSGFLLGSIVDHHKKKYAMLGSSSVTLLLFCAGLFLLHALPANSFTSVASAPLWILIITLLSGVLCGSIYNIAIPTLVATIVPEEMRERANGMFGTVIGISFGVTAAASGVSLAFGGMSFVLSTAIVLTIVGMIALSLTHIPENAPAVTHEPTKKKRVDLRGTISAIQAIPGLFGLIFFTMFNNFLGGLFFALMDAYGLTLVSVQVWGLLWAVLSFSFVLGGLYISKNGLGGNPMRILFRNNIIAWTACIFFVIQPSIILFCIGAFIWMFLGPFTEAIEQTIFQKVVPPDRLGRVLGFAHSVEQSASPLTAFLIGPLAQLIFIPFMTTGAGVDLIGGWFGTGTGRGIALVFITAGFVGLLVTLIAQRSKAYALLAARYEDKLSV